MLIAVVAALALLAAAAGLLLVRRRPAAAPVDMPVELPVELPAVAPPPDPEPVRVVTEAVPAPATISGEVEAPPPPILELVPAREDADPLDALDALLAELEAATVRIDGADELDESAVVELERLAERLVAAAAGLECVG